MSSANGFRLSRGMDRTEQGRVHTFTQAVVGSNMASIAVDSYTQSNVILKQPIYFTLADLPQAASFAALFDQYRITKVSISFIPGQSMVMQNQENGGIGLVENQAQQVAAGNTAVGLYGSVIDYDDAAAIGTLAAFLQYETWKPGQVGSMKIHTRVFKPRVAASVFNGGGFAGYANMTDLWLDVVNTNIQYYGVKFYADIQSQTGDKVAPQSWRIMAKYTVQFKNVR